MMQRVTRIFSKSVHVQYVMSGFKKLTGCFKIYNTGHSSHSEHPIAQPQQFSI